MRGTHVNQWQPRYDPAAHQRRLDDGAPPQGYGQPGYRQPPPQPWPQQQQWPPQQQYGPPPRQPAPRRRKRGGGVIFGILCGVAVVIFIAVASSHGSPSPSPGATGVPAGATSAPAQAAQTVTYVVTGSAADVTYGPEGSDASGTVPLRKTIAIPATPPGYYAIDAQLQGSGTVKCQILVGGTVVSQATATGSYNIASCEIAQDPISGQWQDANAG
jgi:hypothetical protein